MKLMIIGCKGQVGTVLTKLVADSPHYEILALNHKQLDITQEHLVRESIEKFMPDFIINTSAYTYVDKAEIEQEEAYQVNQFGSRNLAKYAAQYNVFLIHLSTDYVFSGNAIVPYRENDLTEPCNVYGLSKLYGEIDIRNHCPNHIILRTSWVFGESGHNFVKTMLKLAQNKREISIVGDQIGGPTAAIDIALTILKIIETIYHKHDRSSLWGTYHYCGFPYVTWAQFGQFIFDTALNNDLIQLTPKINIITSSDYSTLAQRPKNSQLDCHKIQSTFQIAPSKWQFILEKTLQNYLQ